MLTAKPEKSIKPELTCFFTEGKNSEVSSHAGGILHVFSCYDVLCFSTEFLTF